MRDHDGRARRPRGFRRACARDARPREGSLDRRRSRLGEPRGRARSWANRRIPRPSSPAAHGLRWNGSANTTRRCRAPRAPCAGVPWVAWAIIVGAFVLGVAVDRIGGAQRINLLAPPVFALLLWNLAVYAVLVGGFVVHYGDASNPGPLRRLVMRLASRTGHGPWRSRQRRAWRRQARLSAQALQR